MECKELTVRANCISKMGVDPLGIPSNESRSGNIEGSGDEQSGRATWSIEEDMILAKAWIKFSEDRKKLKNSHGNGTFWQHIEKYYNEYRPSGTVKRDWAKLKSHWNQARRKITAFNTIYNELFSARPIGHSDVDVLLQTHEEYKATHKGTKFPYLHLWNIVRYFPMWATKGHTSKKMQTTEPGQHTSSSSADDTVDVDEGEVLPRPVEQQKDMGRKRKAPTANASYSVRTRPNLGLGGLEHAARHEGRQRISDLKQIHAFVLLLLLLSTPDLKSTKKRAATERATSDDLKPQPPNRVLRRWCGGRERNSGSDDEFLAFISSP